MDLPNFSACNFWERACNDSMSIEDQSNINNLFRVVELGGTEFPYQADGGVCRIYTAAEIASILRHRHLSRLRLPITMN